MHVYRVNFELFTDDDCGSGFDSAHVAIDGDALAAAEALRGKHLGESVDWADDDGNDHHDKVVRVHIESVTRVCEIDIHQPIKERVA